MTTINSIPTEYTEVNVLLKELLENIQAVLGSHFIGMYLDGSLTSGDFDQASDIDFVVVTDEDISGDLFLALQAMHERIAAIDSIWAIQLEGSYISKHAIRRYDPAHALHPNIERGEGEQLKMAVHAEPWAIHRNVLHQRGIVIIGPPPQTLIDQVSPDELRQAMIPQLDGWAAHFLDHPEDINFRGYQSYIVLSLCRILYTLKFGGVVSKPTAANWAKETFGEEWVPLIERAWIGRINSNLALEQEDVKGTLDFIRFALAYSQQFNRP
jgi:predicted nucleotidyltransferase